MMAVICARQALCSRHRPRFFRLLRLCLQSTYVPSTVVAAFIKRSGHSGAG
jgi:hypothetical protein